MIERVWAMPNKNTFSIHPIKNLLEQEVKGSVWVDPFANNSNVASITNDLNPKYDTDYHMEAIDFLKMFDDDSVDGVLFDPPYSPRQVKECYEGIGLNVTQEHTRMDYYSNMKNEISRILKRGGKAICFGWNSMGIGKKRGFKMTRVLMVPHGGSKNDTIVTVEVKA